MLFALVSPRTQTMAHSILVTQATTVLGAQWDQIHPEAPVCTSFLRVLEEESGATLGEKGRATVTTLDRARETSGC